MMNKTIWIGVTLATLFANSALAGSCTGLRDYSDADTDYGIACHQTDKWQGLGDGWPDNRLGDSSYSTGSTPSSWTNEYSSSTGTVGHDNATDDGVMWRTSSDPNNFSGAFGTTASLTQGDYVQFQFMFSRSVEGNHKFDELSAWLDWNGDKSWDNSQGSNELVSNLRWYKYNDANDIGVSCEPGLTWNNDTGTCNSDDDFRLYTNYVQIPLDAVVGDTWLRARVTCENSLTHTSSGWIMNPYGYLHQGEVEDYMISIAAKPDDPVDVPEPSGLLIMSPALLFLAIRRRKHS